MAVVRYTALRELSAGHVLGGEYDHYFSPRVLSPSRKLTASKSISIGGNVQTVVSRRDEFWQCEVMNLAVGTGAHDILFEFLQSVDFGEHFLIDINAASVGAAVFRPAMLENSFNQKRIDQLAEFTYQFKIRLLP